MAATWATTPWPRVGGLHHRCAAVVGTAGIWHDAGNCTVSFGSNPMHLRICFVWVLKISCHLCNFSWLYIFVCSLRATCYSTYVFFCFLHFSHLCFALSIVPNLQRPVMFGARPNNAAPRFMCGIVPKAAVWYGSRGKCSLLLFFVLFAQPSYTHSFY